MAVFLIYLIIFFVPLLVLPEVSLRFEPPKVLLTEFLIDVLIVYCIFSGKFSVKRINKLFLSLIGGLFLLSLGHLLLDPDKQNLFGNIFRLQGTILFWHLLALSIIAQNIWFSFKHKYIYLVSFIAICILAFISGTNSAGRLIGSLGEPNSLGAVTILIVPFVILSFKSLWMRLPTILIALGVINFTESKSALIALFLELIFMLLIKITRGKYLLSFGICFALMILSLGFPIAERNYFLSTNTNPLNFRFEDRAQIWNAALVAGSENPVLGSGIESVQDRIHQTAMKLNFDAQYQAIDSSHNIFLDYWVWGGMIAIFLIFSLIILAVTNMSKEKMLVELSVLLGLLTVLSFNPLTVTILAAFWFVLGRSFVKTED